MSSFDIGQQLKSAVLLPPQVWDGDAALVTSDALAVDTAGAEGVAVQVITGAVAGATEIEIAFYEGDTNDFTADSSSEIDARYVTDKPTMDDTANASYIHAIKTNKRYLKIQITRSGTNAATLSANAILGHLSNAPA
jgi:hypothetical protein